MTYRRTRRVARTRSVLRHVLRITHTARYIDIAVEVRTAARGVFLRSLMAVRAYCPARQVLRMAARCRRARCRIVRMARPARCRHTPRRRRYAVRTVRVMTPGRRTGRVARTGSVLRHVLRIAHSVRYIDIAVAVRRTAVRILDHPVMAARAVYACVIEMGRMAARYRRSPRRLAAMARSAVRCQSPRRRR